MSNGVEAGERLETSDSSRLGRRKLSAIAVSMAGNVVGYRGVYRALKNEVKT